MPIHGLLVDPASVKTATAATWPSKMLIPQTPPTDPTFGKLQQDTVHVMCRCTLQDLSLSTQNVPTVVMS